MLRSSEAFSQFFSSIGPGGLAVVLFGMAIFGLSTVVLGKPRFRGTGLMAGVILGLLFATCQPVYTDSPMPPWSLLLIPAGCIIILCSWLDFKRSLLPLAAVIFGGFVVHQAWMDNVFHGYLRDPRSTAHAADREIKREIRFFEMLCREEASDKKILPAGYADEAPFCDTPVPRGILNLKKVRWAREWHTPITGLYRDCSAHVRLFTSGGDADRAAHSIQVVESTL